MRLILNGEPRSVPGPATVADAVAALGAPSRGVAVAVNGEVVSRVDWMTTVLAEGDRVEILTATQGG